MEMDLVWEEQVTMGQMFMISRLAVDITSSSVVCILYESQSVFVST